MFIYSEYKISCCFFFPPPLTGRVRRSCDFGVGSFLLTTLGCWYVGCFLSCKDLCYKFIKVCLSTAARMQREQSWAHLRPIPYPGGMSDLPKSFHTPVLTVYIHLSRIFVNSNISIFIQFSHKSFFSDYITFKGNLKRNLVNFT